MLEFNRLSIALRRRLKERTTYPICFNVVNQSAAKQILKINLRWRRTNTKFVKHFKPLQGITSLLRISYGQSELRLLASQYDRLHFND